MESKMKSQIFSGLIWKFAERFFAEIVTFVVSIVLARLLMPEDYGAIALVMVFITIADVFVTSGFGNALIQKKETDNLDFSSVFFFISSRVAASAPSCGSAPDRSGRGAPALHGR